MNILQLLALAMSFLVPIDRQTGNVRFGHVVGPLLHDRISGKLWRREKDVVPIAEAGKISTTYLPPVLIGRA